MDSPALGQGIKNRRKIMPDGPDKIEHRYLNMSKIGPGSTNIFSTSVGPSGPIFLIFVIPWPRLGLCNDGAS